MFSVIVIYGFNIYINHFISSDKLCFIALNVLLLKFCNQGNWFVFKYKYWTYCKAEEWFKLNSKL